MAQDWKIRIWINLSIFAGYICEGISSRVYISLFLQFFLFRFRFTSWHYIRTTFQFVEIPGWCSPVVNPVLGKRDSLSKIRWLIHIFCWALYLKIIIYLVSHYVDTCYVYTESVMMTSLYTECTDIIKHQMK